MKLRPRVIVHGLDPQQSESVRRYAEDAYDLLEPSDIQSLREALRSSPPLPVVLLGPSIGPEGIDSSSVWRAVREDLYFCATILIVPHADARTLALRRAGEDGANEIMILEVDTGLAALEVTIQSATIGAATRIAHRFFGQQTRARRHLILPNAVLTVARGGDSRSFAGLLEVERRTLTAWCSNAGIPVPRRLLAWTRLLFAAVMLDEAQHSVSEVARLCGYSNANALRTAFSQFLRLSPRQLRGKGAFRCTLEAFHDDRRAARSISPAGSV